MNLSIFKMAIFYVQPSLLHYMDINLSALDLNIYRVFRKSSIVSLVSPKYLFFCITAILVKLLTIFFQLFFVPSSQPNDIYDNMQ